MAGRIRTIKPELLEDERTASLTHEEFRLFVSLILLADDYGNFRANAKMLDGAVFHSRESREGVATLLENLAKASLLVLYRVRGQAYGHLRGWSKHQRVDKPGRPRAPSPTDPEAVVINDVSPVSSLIPESLANHSGESRESFRTDLRSPTTTSDPEREEEIDPGSPPTEPSGSGLPPSSETSPPNPASPPDDAQTRPQLSPLANQPTALAATTTRPLAPQDQQRLLALEPPTKLSASAAEDVFAVYVVGWRRVIRGTRAPVLDAKRRRLVTARLKEFDADFLKAAVRGIWEDSWHVANKQTDFDLIMRDAAHVERFAGQDPGQRPKRNGPEFEEDLCLDAPPMRPSVRATKIDPTKTLAELIESAGRGATYGIKFNEVH